MNSSAEATGRAAHAAGKYLSFFLGKEEYGLPIVRVREIIGLVEITPLPRTPMHVRGVINLRGRIIPVLDLRQRLGMASIEAGPETCIVVVDAARDSETPVQIGCLVDTVSEVLMVDREQFAPAPRCPGGGGEFVLGLGKLGERVLILLDVNQVLGELGACALGQDA